MNVYEAKSYRDFVKASLDGAAPGARRGAVKRLAEFLKVHSTYVSQVTTGKADFSVDQGIRFCAYCGLAADQTEFFLDLLNRDRAATKEAKAHYQMRVDRRLAELTDMKKRWRLADALTGEQELKYYGSWIPQAVHLYCQLPGPHTAASIAAGLRLTEDRVTGVLADLEGLGFVELTARGYRSMRDSVHVGKDSTLISRYHINWRQKAIADFTATPRLPGFHYSSVVSLSEPAAKEIRELILAHIEATRAVIIPAPSEKLFVYCLDFYGLPPD
jgi:hypothetical protein